MTSVGITASTQYIISTSGRPSSMRRYQTLLQRLLCLDIAYIPISSPSEGGKILPDRFTMAIRGMNAIGGAISRDIKGENHLCLPIANRTVTTNDDPDPIHNSRCSDTAFR